MFSGFKTKSKLIVAVALVVVATGAYVGLFFATDTMNEAAYQRSTEAVRAASNEQQATLNKNALSQTASQRAQIAGYVLTESDAPDFISRVENLGRSAGVAVKTNSVATANYPGVKTPGWEALSVSVSTVGSWHDTYGFISALEHLPLRLTFSRASIQQDASGAAGSWNGDFTILVLTRKQSS